MFTSTANLHFISLQQAEQCNQQSILPLTLFLCHMSFNTVHDYPRMIRPIFFASRQYLFHFLIRVAPPHFALATVLILQHDFQYLSRSSPVQSTLIAEMIEATKWDQVWRFMITAVDAIPRVTLASFLDTLVLCCSGKRAHHCKTS